LTFSPRGEDPKGSANRLLAHLPEKTRPKRGVCASRSKISAGHPRLPPTHDSPREDGPEHPLETTVHWITITWTRWKKRPDGAGLVSSLPCCTAEDADDMAKSPMPDIVSLSAPVCTIDHGLDRSRAKTVTS